MTLARNTAHVQKRVERLRALPDFELRWKRFTLTDPSYANISVAFRHPGAGMINTRMTILRLERNGRQLMVQHPADADSGERLRWLATQ
jgi:MmyB-like transcription regulator ligand binding domain